MFISVIGMIIITALNYSNVSIIDMIESSIMINEIGHGFVINDI